jgi:membrane protease YdiL (CAAX protease family)
VSPANRSPDDGRTLGAFLGLAFALTWSVWAVWYLIPDPSPLVQTVAFAAGGFGPSLAAVGVLALRDASPWSWLRERLRLRPDPWPYAVALGVPILAVGAAGLVHIVLLGGTLDTQTVPELWEYPIFLLFVLALGGGQEEAGWRGFLQPALQRKRSPLVASLFVGAVWTVWHLPLFGIPGTIQSSIPIWMYVGQLLGMSVILTWVTNRAEGVILPAMLLHAGGNAVLNYYPVGGAAGATTETGFTILAGVVVLVALVVAVVEGPSLGWE